MQNTNINNDNNKNNNFDTNKLNDVSTGNDDDVNVLSGDNKVDVDIEPDVKENKVNMYVQICSCSIIFHCFSNNNK
jgi:hypothetical protein